MMVLGRPQAIDDNNDDNDKYAKTIKGEIFSKDTRHKRQICMIVYILYYYNRFI